uniref:Retrotransposon gag domain-containing protein n=1 Tax=Chenopodium quinoa TaxID=63459 RepID=A0A803N4P4_CHEQI
MLQFKDEHGANVVCRFKKLQQVGSLEDYIDEFENFSGRKSAVKPFVRAFKPATIASAIEFARLQEESLPCSIQTHSSTLPSSSSSLKPLLLTPLSTFSSNNKAPLLPTPHTKPVVLRFNLKNNKPTRYIPADVRHKKISKGLCYYCYQPYDRNHKCPLKEPQLFTVEIPGVEEILESSDNEGRIENLESLENAEPLLSVNALNGNQNRHTIRGKGMVNERPFHVLIDSGSTHNFLDLILSKKLGCKIEFIPPQSVAVADGNSLKCQHVCKGFTWRIQNRVFLADMLLITLGGFDMILGVKWLTTLGIIKWASRN